MSYIEKLRYEKGLKQKDLAAHVGVSQQSYSRWVGGLERPGIKYAKKLAEYFDISFDKLLVDTPGSNLSSLTEQNRREIEEVISNGILKALERYADLKDIADSLRKIANSAPKVSGDRKPGRGRKTPSSV